MDVRRPYFEEIASRWDALQPGGREERIRQLLAAFAPDLQCARTVLDVGTGTGALLPLLRDLAPGAQLAALDLAQAMLLRARARSGQAAALLADAHALPLATASIDAIVCHSVFPHFRDKARALSELRRVLRPGGRLLILHDSGRAVVNRIHSQAQGPIHADLLPPADTLRELLMATGLEEVQVEDAPDHYLACGRAPAEKALVAEALAVRYAAGLALTDVSLHIAAGELVGLFGPNGAGKSTLLRTALGLVPIEAGRLTVLGCDVTSPRYRQVRPRVGYVPQKPPEGRFPVTVWEAIAMGRYGRAGLGRGLSRADRALVDAALRRLDLEALAGRFVQQLSGGQAQRVCIARALAQEPALLLLDEPTASLDRTGQLEIAHLVRDLNRERGVAVALVSHNPDVARLCHRLYYFDSGHVVELQGSEELGRDA
jgi:ABC-type cobalamin/Fe3+-siderophores transport system ATPase subunit/ubiquinone/menaquinone biosynthesis C-methylase UbiE